MGLAGALALGGMGLLGSAMQGAGGTVTDQPQAVRTPEQQLLQQYMLRNFLTQMGQPAQAYPGQLGAVQNPLAPAALGMVSNYLGIPTGTPINNLSLPPMPARPVSPAPTEPMSQRQLERKVGKMEPSPPTPSISAIRK